MNERSSRAHTILLLTVTQRREDTDALVRSHLYLVDLAGSERLKKSKAVGVRKNEAVGINSSLMVLGKCIAALVEGKPHIPYNESKLTMILKAAFGGNSRTTAVVTCHSDDKHADETLQVCELNFVMAFYCLLMVCLHGLVCPGLPSQVCNPQFA